MNILKLATEAARARKGQCLTGFYQGGGAHFRFRCERDHVWAADANKILGGAWCPRCKRVERHFSDVKSIVAAHKGKIIGSFKNSRTPLLVECSNGHKWGVRSSSLMKGSWCARCAFDRASHTIEDMHQIARKRQGKCLSETYSGVHIKLLWQCKEGHVWSAKPNGVLGGRWCAKCAGVMRLTIEEMHEIAAKNQGFCLSEDYKNGREKLQWRCSKGHEWSAVPANVVNGAWCPICAFDFVRFTLEDVQQMAIQRGGECLALVYVNGRQRIGWRCADGHMWKAMAKSVSRGAWCRKCANSARKPKLKVETLQAYAKANGGRLVSSEIRKGHEPLEWQCAAGHSWVSSWTKLSRKGRWCRQCSRKARATGHRMGSSSTILAVTDANA